MSSSTPSHTVWRGMVTKLIALALSKDTKRLTLYKPVCITN